MKKHKKQKTKNKKTKNKKHKKENPTYNLSPPHLFQKKNVLDGLSLGRKRKKF